MNVVVTTSIRAGAHAEELAKTVAARLGVPYQSRNRTPLPDVLSEAGLAGTGGVLVVESLGMTVVTYQDNTELGRLRFHPGMAPIRIQRLEEGGLDHMVEAMRLSPGDSVLDCTLGLGSDAIVASWVVGEGGAVVGVEASPVVAELVRVGLQSYNDAREDVLQAMRRIDVVHADSRVYLEALNGRAFDVVYFDPMFREPVRSSTGIKPLRRWAVSKPLDRETIMVAARAARRFVVVKDRRGGGELERLGIATSVGGKGSSVEYGVLPAWEGPFA
ncbi:MAG: class I SAM-dependent methyltransferase [Firmicutes bacterium]|jgi:SAM-dependent methyltransferase|nr:class I SAM-dependent methyltransferase [Bacillota bacterium]